MSQLPRQTNLSSLLRRYRAPNGGMGAVPPSTPQAGSVASQFRPGLAVDIGSVGANLNPFPTNTAAPVRRVGMPSSSVGGTGGPTMLDQLADAALVDVANTEAARDFNFQRNEDAIGAFGASIPQARRDQIAAGETAYNELGVPIQRLREQGGDDLATFDRNAADTIRVADEYAQRSMAEAERAITETEDRRSQDLSANLLGLRQRMQSEESQDFVNPDGTMRSPAEIADIRRNREVFMNQQIASASIAISSQYNQLMASLRTNLSSTALSAGSLAAGTRQALTIGRLQAEAGRREAETIAANLDQVRSTIKQQAVVSAIQDEMNGLKDLAALKMSNPYSPVSMLSAFAQLAGVASAPGINNLSGISINADGSARLRGTSFSPNVTAPVGGTASGASSAPLNMGLGSLQTRALPTSGNLRAVNLPSRPSTRSVRAPGATDVRDLGNRFPAGTLIA